MLLKKTAILAALVFMLAYSGMAMAKICAPGTGCTVIVSEANSACTLVGCLSTPLPRGSGSALVTITGTFIGTLEFEQSGDNGITWTSITGNPQPSGVGATSATDVGVWSFDLSARTNFRVRASAFSNGTAEVTISVAPATMFSLVTNVRGVLPIANGGTGSASGFTLDQILSPAADWTPTIGAHNVTITGTGAWNFGAMPISITTLTIGGRTSLGTVHFASRGAVVAGQMFYCDDCDPSTVSGTANECSSSGTKTGALAIGTGTKWACLTVN